jgi:hypothetical protein
MIELLLIILALVTGVVTATYAYSAWGIWGGVAGFLVGALSPWGVTELTVRLFPHKRPRCACGQCGVGDFVYERDVDGPFQVYACGRMYRWGDDGQRHLLTKDPEGKADERPRE